jgi:catabolite regulation protein CreA
MKCFTFAATLASLGAALGAARADVSVLDNDKTIEVDCAKDPQVNLLGNHLTVTLKGVCARVAIDGNEATVSGSAGAVRVNGNHNTITLDAADQVAIYGNDNTVTVQKPIKAKKVQISSPGSRNKVTRPK